LRPQGGNGVSHGGIGEGVSKQQRIGGQAPGLPFRQAPAQFGKARHGLEIHPPCLEVGAKD
jgi:hypothetical protein